MRKGAPWLGAALVLVAALGLRFFSAAPGGNATSLLGRNATPSSGAYATPAACDDAGFVALAATHPRGYTEVTVCGTVARVLPVRTTRSGRHKYFYVRLDAAGDTVEVVTNVDETGDFDVAPGDTANVRGRYYYDDASSQGIDWTHHNDAGSSWPYPGYVQIDGGRLVR